MDYLVILKENYIGIIIGVGVTLVSVIIGGMITLGVNLKIQRREREIIYAKKNREEIYEPLYNEIKKIVGYLNSIDFSSYGIYSRAWDDLEESKKIRAPVDLINIIKQFKDNGIKYMAALNKAQIDLLPTYIKQEIKELMIENNIEPNINESIYINKKTELVNHRIHSDLLAGKILKKESSIKDYLIGEITFKDFFERLNSKISKREEFISIRKERIEMNKIAMKLEKYLKNKIEYISKKYEGKLSKI